MCGMVKFARHFLICFEGDFCCGYCFRNEFLYFLDFVLREANGPVEPIEYPAQDFLLIAPEAIKGFEFF